MKALPIRPVLGLFARLCAVAVLIAALSLLVPAPVKAQDMSDIVLRLNQLENQVRRLSGEVEDLQYENRRLRQELERFEEDVEFRFEDLGASAAPRRSTGSSSPATATPGETVGSAPAQATEPPTLGQAFPTNGSGNATPPQGRADAFDPGRDPAAPGAPQPLGSTTPSAPLALPGARFGAEANGADASEAPAGNTLSGLTLPRLESPQRLDGRVEDSPARPSIAATGDADPRILYDEAYGLLTQERFEEAEMAFRQFLQSHPRDALAPEALFWLGESYRARGLHREAAEQYLTVSTDHADSARAPQALLRLGSALAEIGAREQACATLAEIPRQYPDAASALQESIAREEARVGCA
jgi:tol-pal system protein YbgF